MALIGKSVAQVATKSDSDVFHEFPPQIPDLTPTTIQNCQTHDGEFGTVGSVLFWNYFLDGTDCVAKTLIDNTDEGKKSVTFKVLEGDLLEIYKSLVMHVHVDTDGLDNLVTWTVEYEKLNPDVPDPDTLTDFYRKATKDIETHHLNN